MDTDLKFPLQESMLVLMLILSDRVSLLCISKGYLSVVTAVLLFKDVALEEMGHKALGFQNKTFRGLNSTFDTH